MTAHRRFHGGLRSVLVGGLLALALSLGWSGYQALGPDVPPPRPAESRESDAVSSDVVLVGRHGRAVPDATASGVAALHAALAAGDVGALRSRLAPGATAPEPAVLASRLAVPSVRAAMAETLRTAPTIDADGSVVYGRGNYGVVLDRAGAIVHLGSNTTGRH